MVEASAILPAWVLMSGNQNHPVIMGVNGGFGSSVIIRHWRRDRGRRSVFGEGVMDGVLLFVLHSGVGVPGIDCQILPKTAKKMGFFEDLYDGMGMNQIHG